VLAKVDAARGSAKQVIGGWRDYFGLKARNRELLNVNLSLLNENIYLRTLSEDSRNKDDVNSRMLRNIECIPANVVENTLNRDNNKLILNAGKNDGVEKDMGVISPDGVVGIVDRVSDNFSTVTSLLNTSRSVNGKLKSTGIYGPLVWDRKDIRYIDMIDIPQHITIMQGEEVVTSGHSLIFPEGILIGTVESYRLDRGVSYKVRIKLNNDFRSLYNVYVISAENKAELDSLKREIQIK
jgi:rod shape-determining protein MreC